MLGSNPIQNVAGCPTSYGNGQSLNPILHVVMSHVIMVQGALDEVLPAMNAALRMADVDEVFIGLNQLTGAPLVDSFLDGTRSIQNMLTERNFLGIPTGLK